jgi:hypothetical protein
MRRSRVEGTTCSLILNTTDKKQVDTQWYVTTFVGIPFLTTTKVILFYAGVPALEKRARSMLEVPTLYNVGVIGTTMVTGKFFGFMTF